MEIEQKPRQASEQKEDRPQDILRKETVYFKFKTFMAYLVKMFEFDAIPVATYKQIYVEDPVATFKNQITYYVQLVEQCAQDKLNISNDQLWPFLIEHQQETFRKYSQQVTGAIINLKAPELMQAFEKEIRSKRNYFDPDFTGSIGFSNNLLRLDFKTNKDKVYPKVIISSVRKVIRMILIVQTIFLLIYKDLKVDCNFTMYYGKNQIGSDLHELINFELDSRVTLNSHFIISKKEDKNEVSII